MSSRHHLIDAYHAASPEEQALYVKVKGHGPGMEGHNPQEWQEWLDPVSRTTAASRAMREDLDDPGTLEPS